MDTDERDVYIPEYKGKTEYRVGRNLFISTDWDRLRQRVKVMQPGPQTKDPKTGEWVDGPSREVIPIKPVEPSVVLRMHPDVTIPILRRDVETLADFLVAWLGETLPAVTIPEEDIQRGVVTAKSHRGRGPRW